MQYTISVIDLSPPQWVSLPEDINLSCGDAVPTELPVAQDACGNWELQQTSAEIPGTCEGSTLLMRHFTATDACGNQNHHTQQVHFLDLQAPLINFTPQDLSIACGEPITEAFAQATDGCGPVTLSFEDTETPLDCPQNKTIHRWHTATDGCNNQSSSLQIIEIRDQQPPLIEGPGFLNATCDQSQVPLMFASDLCSNSTLTFQSTPLANPDIIGQALRIYTATDDCGNSATAMQLVTYPPDDDCGGCTAPQASNFNPQALFENFTCVIADAETCMGDLDLDGIVSTSDLLFLLAAFESTCP
jgi:hypothetical protein